MVELQNALAQSEWDHRLVPVSGRAAPKVGTRAWEADTNRVNWSPQTDQIFGLRPGSFDGTYDGFFALAHPDDRQRLTDAIAAALEERSFYLIE